MSRPRVGRLIALVLLPLIAAPACSIASADFLPLPGPSSSATPGIFAEAGAGQFAEAFWFVRRPRRIFLFAAGAVRGVGAGTFFGEPFVPEVESFGFVARATCRRVSRRRFRCEGRAVGRELSPTQFQADPLLESAQLRMRGAGFAHVARWAGQGARPDPDVFGVFGDVFVFGVAGADRRARASGRLFGRHVAARHGEFAYLAEGGGGFVGVEPGVGAFEFVREVRLSR